MIRASGVSIGLLTPLLLVAGCAVKEKLEPLAPQFTVTVPVGGGQRPMAADPLSGNDQGGALYVDELRESRPVGRGLDNAAPNRFEGLSRTVEAGRRPGLGWVYRPQ